MSSTAGTQFTCFTITSTKAQKLTQKRHAVMYRNHGQRCALKFSDYGTAAGDGGHRYDRCEHVLLFDTVHPVRLDGYQLLFSLRSSDFYVLNVLLDADGKVLALLFFFCTNVHMLTGISAGGPQTVKGLAVDKVHAKVDCAVGCATTLTRIGLEHLFVGARQVRSLLALLVQEYNTDGLSICSWGPFGPSGRFGAHTNPQAAEEEQCVYRY